MLKTDGNTKNSTGEDEHYQMTRLIIPEFN